MLLVTTWVLCSCILLSRLAGRTTCTSVERITANCCDSAPKPANLSFNSLICSCQLSLTSLSSTRQKLGRLCCAFLPQVHGKSTSWVEYCPCCGQEAAACRCCVQAAKKASDGKRGAGALRGAAGPQAAQLASFRASTVSRTQTRQRGTPCIATKLV